MAYPKPTGDINNHFSEDMPGRASHPSQDKSVGLANPGIIRQQ
jgi:hypothetical protein